MKGRLTRSLSPRNSAIIGLLDQGLSSGSNFLIVIAAARLLSVQEFGAFSVVFVAYTIIIGGIQAFIGQELVLAVGGRLYLASRSVAAARTAFLATIPISLALAIWGIVSAELRGPLIALAIALPVLSIHEIIRFAAGLIDSIQLALLIDMVWTVAVVLGLVGAGLGFFGTANATTVMIIWATSGLVSLIPLVIFVPRIRRLETRISLYRIFEKDYLGHRFFGEFFAVRATGQGLTIVLGAMAGVAATGSVRAATTLFGPLNVVLSAAAAFTIPILRRFEPRRRELLTGGLALGLGAISAILMVVLLLLPAEAGQFLLGATWEGTYQLIAPIGAQTIALSISTVAVVALRIVDPRATLAIRVIGAVIVVVTFFVGFAVDGVLGATWGLSAAAIAQAVLLVGKYFQLRGRPSSETLIPSSDGEPK